MFSSPHGHEVCGGTKYFERGYNCQHASKIVKARLCIRGTLEKMGKVGRHKPIYLDRSPFPVQSSEERLVLPVCYASFTQDGTQAFEIDP